MAKCYKVVTAFLTDQAKPPNVMTIFDTEIGLNFVRENYVPTQWLNRVQPICANIREPGNMIIKVEGVVKLWIKICGHITTAVCGFAPKFVTKTMFGTAIIVKENKRVERKNRWVIFNGGHVVAIVKSVEEDATVQSLNGAKTTTMKHPERAHRCRD